jgi:hypothetical protein
MFLCISVLYKLFLSGDTKFIFDNEELGNFHSLPDIIRTVKSRMINCTEHVKWMGDMA